MSNIFVPADILLPDTDDWKNWAVVACDQYSSQPEYWSELQNQIRDNPSTLNLILPEAWLNTPEGRNHEARIDENMDKYLKEGLFRTYGPGFIYVERTLGNQLVRKGLIGAVDLEAYDYLPGTAAAIRATEATIVERIPPRMKIRSQASLELPHVILLADDRKDQIFNSISSLISEADKVYDFDLNQNGGHITGWFLSGSVMEAIARRLSNFETESCHGNLKYVVGDGNHSLASARAWWNEVSKGLSPEERANHPARYALVELESLYDPSLQFEPIHRLLKNVDVPKLKSALKNELSGQGQKIVLCDENGSEEVCLNVSEDQLVLSVLQPFLDSWLLMQSGEIDYIHGDDDLKRLAGKPGNLGILVPSLAKESLFDWVIENGSLPRKTFSMGYANEKRYYLEARKIR